MNNLVVQVLKNPLIIDDFTDNDWMLFVAQGYATYLLGRLCNVISAAGLIESTPDKVKWHLLSAERVSQAHNRDVAIEVRKIKQVLKISGVQPVFLKGTAYLLANDIAAQGRVFADVDVYVPREKIPVVENALRWGGWIQEKLNRHDQAYYRKWMHELPPMVNKARGTTLDVHHSLLPLTSRFKLDSNKLNVVDINIQNVLPATDRLLHSIVHLFMETEFDKGLRDLSDIDLLIREHSGKNQYFWIEIITRAKELGIGRLLFYGVRYSQLILATPVNESVSTQIEALYAPFKPVLKVMDCVMLKAITTPKSLDKSVATNVAHFALFLRGHWLKMPIHILLYHTAVKSLCNLTQLFWNGEDAANKNA